MYSLILILPLQQPDMALLRRAPTKLKEVRDFHMEKAINSSMPKGQSEEGRQGGREDVWRYKQKRKVWGSTRAKKNKKQSNITVSDSKHWSNGDKAKYQKLATFDVVLPNVHNQNPWVLLIPKNTLERKEEKVVKDKQIDERERKWETAKGK